MHDLSTMLFFAKMVLAPLLIANRNLTREAVCCARKELLALRRSGKSPAGTLYALPGLEVVEISSESQPSAARRAA